MTSQTLAYFSLFKRPLTKREFDRARWHEDHTTPHTTNHLMAFSPEDIRERHRRTLYSDLHMKTATHATRVIRYIPFVRAIFLCNTVAMGAAQAGSDVDLFIVTAAKRLWITRLLVTVMMAVTGMRRSKNTVAGKICLSFYVSEDGLNLGKIAIDEDIYLAYWLHTLRPLYDPTDIQSALYHKNSWAKRKIPNGLTISRSRPGLAVQPSKELPKRIVETMWKAPFGDLLESQAKQIQQTKMKLNRMSVQHDDNTNVVISDTMLKFHENDRRQLYHDEWNALKSTTL